MAKDMSNTYYSNPKIFMNKITGELFLSGMARELLTRKYKSFPWNNNFIYIGRLNG